MTVIKINKENKVVAILRGELATTAKIDNTTFFEVESAPKITPRADLYFDPQTRTFNSVEKDLKIIEARAEAYKKKTKALKWLSDNDWKVNKNILGEWADDDERWLEYLAGREDARKAYDEAIAILDEK